MSPRPDFRRYWVPVGGFFWGLCMTLAALISHVQDLSFHFTPYPLLPYLLLSLPGYLVAAGWLLVRLVR